MQELYEGFFDNLLAGAKIENLDETGANRARH